MSLVTGTSVVRTDALQSYMREVYMPAGINQLFDDATQLRDSLILIEKSMDRLNQVWEIYNKKGGLNVEENPDLDVDDIDTSGTGIDVDTPDDAIVINVDVENLDEVNDSDFPDEDFDPNVILLSHANSADLEKLHDLAEELEVLQAKLTEANGGVEPPLAEQLGFVIAGINEIEDTEDIVYWQNDTLPDDDIDLLMINLDSEAESIPYGNQIRDAVSASQATNEEARQELRKALFTWEEFVKSAGSVIERLSRMIEGFARGIKGQ